MADKKKYSVIQLNEYNKININHEDELLQIEAYLIYSDGSVRIKLYWRNTNTTEGQIIRRTCNLPFNIDTNKYHYVSITQADVNAWHYDAAYSIHSNTIDLTVVSHAVDFSSTLILEIFAFI